MEVWRRPVVVVWMVEWEVGRRPGPRTSGRDGLEGREEEGMVSPGRKRVLLVMSLFSSVRSWKRV